MTSLAALACAVLPACSSAFVREDFASHDVVRVAVPPVENATPHRLEAVAVHGFLQESVFGGRRYDLPDLLRGALEEVLVLKGYDVVEAPDAPQEDAGAAHAPYDALLHATIESWQPPLGGRVRLAMAFRVELHDAKRGDLLFSRQLPCRHRVSTPEPSLERVVRQCARVALDALPGRSAGDGR